MYRTVCCRFSLQGLLFIGCCVVRTVLGSIIQVTKELDAFNFYNATFSSIFEKFITGFDAVKCCKDE